MIETLLNVSLEKAKQSDDLVNITETFETSVKKTFETWKTQKSEVEKKKEEVQKSINELKQSQNVKKLKQNEIL